MELLKQYGALKLLKLLKLLKHYGALKLLKHLRRAEAAEASTAR